HQHVGERFLHLGEYLAAYVVDLEARHPRGGTGAVEPPGALAAELDRLADGHGVLLGGRAELFRGVRGAGIRAQPGRDLAGVADEVTSAMRPIKSNGATALIRGARRKISACSSAVVARRVAFRPVGTWKSEPSTSRTSKRMKERTMTKHTA